MNLIKKKIQDLRKIIYRWDYLYFIQSKFEVSDEIYDATLEELNQLELMYPHLITKDSPTRCINYITQGDFRKIYHKAPMLSLNSTIKESQLLLFDKRTRMQIKGDNRVVSYCCELKIDGVAVSLLYEKGKLVCAATRGDGQFGEDITKNVQTINSVPICLNADCHYDNGKAPYLLEIRGEVFISKLCFLKLNEIIEKKGGKSFSNARNAASGSVRQLDASITAKRPLSFYCYGISYYIGEEELPNSHWKRLQLCKVWGFPIANHMKVVKNIQEVFQYSSYIESIRSDLKFNIDGIVIKVDNCSDQKQLGYGSKAPNWAIAYKFSTTIQSSKIKNVIFKVGRTGMITPIAYIEPIIISNVVIKKVNIYNINKVKRLGLMIGDIVRIQRVGDVIPKILEVLVSKRTNAMEPVVLPSVCPVCNSVIKTWTDQSVLRCTAGLFCSAQLKAMLKHFASKKAMNIRGMGVKIIDQLVDNGWVRVPVDFFYLNKNTLLCLNRFDSKAAEQLLLSIAISKKTTLLRFIYALGIPNVGERIASHLADFYKTIENLIDADLNSLSNLQYIGKVVAADIYYFFKNSNNLKNIHDLMHPDVGLKWTDIV